MGLACNLVISFAAAVGSPTVKETYNINENVDRPDIVCRGAAIVTALDRPVGTNVAFALTKDDITVEKGSGSFLRLENRPADPNRPDDKGSFQFRKTLDNGKQVELQFFPGDKPTDPIPQMREQLRKDTTRIAPSAP